MPIGNSAPSTFERNRREFLARTTLQTRSEAVSITAQLMEIARVQTRNGVAGDAHKAERAGKSYAEALRWKRDSDAPC
jgi:hypothetical protein